MDEKEIVALIEGLLNQFFKNNPTIQELEALLPKVLNALANAKAGKAFSTPGIPLTISGVKGKFDFAWAPDAP